MTKTIIFSIFITMTFSACFGGGNGQEEWTSLIYPDKNNTKRSKKYAVYKTLEECKTGSLKELGNLGLENKGDYQCGLNCEYHEGMKVDICEKLSK